MRFVPTPPEVTCVAASVVLRVMVELVLIETSARGMTHAQLMKNVPTRLDLTYATVVVVTPERREIVKISMNAALENQIVT